MNENTIGHFDAFNECQHPRLHDHLCFLYETESEWKAFVAIYIKTGLEQGEKCLYIFDTHTSRQVHDLLKSEGVEVAAFEASGQLSIIHGNHVFGADNDFNPNAMRAFLLKEIAKAQADGYPVLRVTGESDWIIRYRLTLQDEMQYEAAMDHDFIPFQACLMVCQYNKDQFAADFINSLLINHRCVIMKNKINSNIYYLLTDESGWSEKKGIDTRALLTMIEKNDIRARSQQNKTRTLEVLLDESHSAVIAVDDQGLIVDVNQMAADVFEISILELINRHISEFAPGAAALKPGFDINPFGVVRHGELEVVINGQPKILTISVVTVIQAGRRLFYAIGRDLTLSRLAERVLQENQDKLRQICQFSDQGIVFLKTSCGLAAANPELRISEVNPAFEKISGLTAQQVVGQRFSDLFSQEDLPAFNQFTAGVDHPPSKFKTRFTASNLSCQVVVFKTSVDSLVALISTRPPN
jgi:PAS domain S-box-containing protein